jgi:hypothetical protein
MDVNQALDPSAGSVDDVHREHSQLIQQVIVDLVADHATRSVTELTDRLSAALARAGIAAQPASWLSAVAHEAASGRVYVVSRAALVATGVQLPAMTALQQGRLNGEPLQDRVRRGDQAN